MMIARFRLFAAGALVLAAAQAAHAQGFGAGADSTGGALRFRTLGPTVAGGRVAAVAGVAGDPDTYWVGSASGGVWKTTNGGNSWEEVFKDQPTASIGAVALAPSNPNVVWVGTGEGNPRNDITNGHGVFVSPDAGRTWRFAGLPEVGQVPRIAVDPQDPDHALVAALGKVWVPNPDRGIFRTRDGGRTWKRVLYVNDTTGAVDVAFQPGNPRVVFAATWQMRRFPWEMVDGGPGSGVWRSTDGGETWTRLHGGLPEGIVGRIALGIAPSNPNHLYAVAESREGTVWESTDAGDHWRRVTTTRAVSVRPWYFSQVNVAPDDENHVYFASFNLMESRDGGRTVRAVDSDVHPDHHALWIDPRDPRRMIQGNDGGVFVTPDGGRTWRFLNNLPIEQFYSVNLDGSTPYNLCGGLQDNNGWCGPSASTGSPFVSQSRWISVTGGDGQYVVPAPSDSTILYVDSQNGAITRVDLKTGVTRSVRPYLPTVSEMEPAQLQYRFNWTSPIAVGPTNANEVYIGGNVLFRSTDGGQTWRAISPDLTNNEKAKQRTSGGPINHDISGAETYNTILTITLAPSDPNVIWVGTDDGNVQVTRDGGRTWTNVRPRGLPAEGRVYQVGVSPFDPGVAFVTLDRHEFADNRPYVLRTDNWGRSWTRIEAGLPADQPAHVVREDPARRGFLVLGTDNGLFWSRDNGAHWTRFESFPHSPVWDLKFAPRTHDLVVATHGRGILMLDDISGLENLTPETERSAFEVFRPLPATSFYGRQFGGVEPSAFQAPNAPRGAVINYWLADKVQPRGGARRGAEAGPGNGRMGRPGETRGGRAGAATDTTSRQTGGVAPTAEPGAAVAASPSGEGNAEEPAQTGGGPGGGSANRPVRVVVLDATGDTVTTATAPGEKGLNRWVWNLRYAAPTRITFEREGGGGEEGGGGGRGGGPAALPGTYTVNLIANGVTRSTQVQVVPDPRLPWDTLAARQQFVFARRLTHQVSALNTMLNRIHSLRGQIANAQTAMRETGARGGEFAGRLRSLDQRLQALSDSIYNPSVQRGVTQDDIHFLRDFQGTLQGLGFGGGGYNQAPTPLVTERAAAVTAQLERFLAQYNALVQNDVAAYNRDAAARGAPTLVAGGPVTVRP